MAKILAFLLLTSLLFAKDTRAYLYTNMQSALSMDTLPKHIHDSHLPYSNPKAKKGGSIKLMSLGGFDSLDLFVLKGNKASDLDLIYDSLMAQSLDEPYAVYPLIAQRVSIASDYSGVRFYINPLAKFSDGSPIRAEDVKFRD